MKKLLFLGLVSGLLFSADLNTINQKLDLIINKLNKIEKELSIKDNEIKELKKQLKIQQTEIKKQQIQTKKEFAIKNCKNLKVVSYKYEYHDEVLPYYDISVTLKNDYPYTVKRFIGNIYFDDKDGTTLLKVYIDKKAEIKPNQTFTIKTQYMVSADIEKELSNENSKNLNVYFDITKLQFANGKTLECY